jgi:hypothetical protein
MDELTARLSDEPELAAEYAAALEHFLALGGADLEVRAREVTSSLGLDADRLHRPLASFSGGEAARAALVGLIGDKPVRCEPKDRDRYGRLVAACAVDGRDLGAALADGGWVFAFERYTRHYAARVAAARAAGRGVWGSKVEAPWEYRARQQGEGEHGRI